MAAATPAWQLVQRRARSIAADCLPQYELQFYHGTHFQCPEDAISHCVRDTNPVFARYIENDRQIPMHFKKKKLENIRLVNAGKFDLSGALLCAV